MIVRIYKTIAAFLRSPMQGAFMHCGVVLPAGAHDIRVEDLENLPCKVVYYRGPTRAHRWRARVDAARAAWRQP